MSAMDAAAANNPVLQGVEDVAKQLVWAAFEAEKTRTISIHGHFLGVPFSISVPLSEMKVVLEILAGPEPTPPTVASV